MFKKLRSQFKDYCDRNEKSHMQNQIGFNDFELSDISKELEDRLNIEKVGELFVLEIHNDDLTPLKFVVKIIQKYCLQPESRAYEIAMNTHKNGKSQALAGEESALIQVAELIEFNAREYKFPLKCIVKRV